MQPVECECKRGNKSDVQSATDNFVCMSHLCELRQVQLTVHIAVMYSKSAYAKERRALYRSEEEARENACRMDALGMLVYLHFAAKQDKTRQDECDAPSSQCSVV